MPRAKNGQPRKLGSKVAAEARNIVSTARRIEKNTSYTRPLRQGVAAAVTKPFGAAPVRRNRVSKRRALRYFSALSPHHLALPRAVGPYTVIRTTSKHTVTQNYTIWGPTTQRDSTATEFWTNIIGVGDVDDTLAMSTQLNTTAITDSTFGTIGAVAAGWDQCMLTPAAFTIQVMNSTPVTSAGGIAYIGKMKTLPDLAGSGRTWSQFGDQFIAYNYPRLCSGGKLALRGVTVSAVPYNMSDLADFRAVFTHSTGDFTWNGGAGLGSLEFAGFAPIVIAKTSEMASLEVLVTVEWRVRFDPSNPAQASHKLYQPSSDASWAAHVAAESLRGTEDIAETIADVGVEAAGVALAGIMLA